MSQSCALKVKWRRNQMLSYGRTWHNLIKMWVFSWKFRRGAALPPATTWKALVSFISSSFVVYWTAWLSDTANRARLVRKMPLHFPSTILRSGSNITFYFFFRFFFHSFFLSVTGRYAKGEINRCPKAIQTDRVRRFPILLNSFYRTRWLPVAAQVWSGWSSNLVSSILTGTVPCLNLPCPPRILSAQPRRAELLRLLSWFCYEPVLKKGEKICRFCPGQVVEILVSIWSAFGVDISVTF